MEKRIRMPFEINGESVYASEDGTLYREKFVGRNCYECDYAELCGFGESAADSCGYEYMGEVELPLVINATPHDVVILSENGEVVRTFPTSRIQFRLTTAKLKAGTLDGIPLIKEIPDRAEVIEKLGNFTLSGRLPDEVKGVYYLVSARVKSALPKRKDLLVPAEQVRDEAGRVIGCRSLSV